MTQNRRIFFYIAAVISIAGTIHHSWAGSSAKKSQAKISTEMRENLEQFSESRFLDWQAKITIGYSKFLRELSKDFPANAGSLLSYSKPLQDSLKQQVYPSPEEKKLAQVDQIILKKLIVADFFDFSQAKPAICSIFSKVESSTLDGAARILSSLCLDDSRRLDSSEIEIISQELGWYADLIAARRHVNQSDSVEAAARAVKGSEKSLRQFGVITLTAFFVIPISGILFSIFLYKLLRGKLVFRFKNQGVPSDYAFEIFVLYICGMLASVWVNQLVVLSGLKLRPISVSLVWISLLLLLILWPCLFGFSLSETRKKLGLIFNPPLGPVKDAVLGAASYIASITPLIFFLFLYSIVLMKFQVHPSQGSHPAVPALAGAKNDPGMKLSIILLAVVLAPIIEEIMFRGALYSWLRERLSAAPAIFISAFLFASLHPQGLVGLAPLTAIGIVLGFLREWRGNLTVCMAAHACVNGGTLSLLLLLFG